MSAKREVIPTAGLGQVGSADAQERPTWLPIDSAPKDGTPIIAASFGRYGSMDRVWWQPEFEAWIVSCRQMVMAPGYTINGQTSQLHSPEVRTPSHWIAMPEDPA